MANSRQPQPFLTLRYWIVALVVAAGGFFFLDRVFASDQIWKLPLSLLVNYSRDRSTRSAWLVGQPPNGRRQIVLLGASNAFAAMELPEGGTTRLFREALHRNDIDFLSLAAGGMCYDEYLVLLENLLQRGHRVEFIIAFALPGCLEKQGRRPDASRATKMPLTSAWLLDTQRKVLDPSLDDRSDRWLTHHVALARHRRAVNAWMRSRFSRAVNGNTFLHIGLRENRYLKPWNGPFERDVARYSRIRTLPERMDWNGPGVAYLASFLARSKASDIPVLLVEVPWSPPMRQLLEPIRYPYKQLLGRLASRYDATYWDPNEELYLGSQHFADVYHVTQEGRGLFLNAAVSKSREFLRFSSATGNTRTTAGNREGS